MPTADNARFGQEAVGAINTPNQLDPRRGSTGGVIIKAHNANVGPVYLGHDNTVSATTGYELSPGQSITLELLNIGRLWIFGGTAADRISWATVNA